MTLIALAVAQVLAAVALLISIVWTITEQDRGHSTPFQFLGILMSLATALAVMASTINKAQEAPVKVISVPYPVCAEKP